MPTYAYACTVCEHRFEAHQSFTDSSLTICPECAGRLRKIFPTVGVVFKGSGFYHNDSRASHGARSAAGSVTSGESASSGSSESSGSGEPSGSGESATPTKTAAPATTGSDGAKATPAKTAAKSPSTAKVGAST